MDKQIDFTSKTPFHVQAEQILRQMINSEEYCQRSGTCTRVENIAKHPPTGYQPISNGRIADS